MSTHGHAECPRCGEALATFALADARAVICEACEYADVPANHRSSTRGAEESWESALERFRGGGTGETERDRDAEDS